jgi:hypothetical protein
LKYVHEAGIFNCLKIKIGASNLLDETLVYVVTQIAFETPLYELSLDIGYKKYFKFSFSGTKPKYFQTHFLSTRIKG